MRVVLVTGKGGVGKTTLSTATALAAADAGAHTLLVSTDAAHSLADVLDHKVDVDPVPITDNLDGLQLDARHELQRSWGTIAGYLRRLLGLAELDRLQMDELVVVPGLDQLVALARLNTLAASGEWDAIVVDCAPSADSLRLLSLPEVLNWYVDRLFGRHGTIARLGRRHIERSFALPLPDDRVVASVEQMSDELSQLRAMLNATTTTARVVVTPERVVIAEAQRTLAYLALYGYAVDAILVNRVPDADVAVPQLARIAEVFGGLPQLRVRYRAAEPIGLDALREVGRELYPEVDPLARMANTPALEITSAGEEATMRLFMPGANRDEIDLELDADELIVSMGVYRRTVKLPDGLQGRPVRRAGLSGQHLEVVFGEAAGDF